jgi:glycosyltransferase involved in cell wall biosynthesis
MPGRPPLRLLLVAKGLDLGGIERVVVDLAAGLTDRGVAVDVAVVNADRDRLVPPLVEAGVTVHRLDGSDLIGVGGAVRLVRLVRSGAFDVVHVHGPLPAAVVRLAAIGAEVRVVSTSHTPWTSLRRITRLCWRVTARLDAAAIAVSSAVAASLPASTRRRATVIPHGVDPNRIAVARTTVDRPANRSSDGTVTAVTVASHRDVKNYPNLLRAVRHAIDTGADLRLVAVGDGPARDTHVALARSLGLDDIVDFVPSTEDALGRIAAADLLVVASDFEGQPMVVAEALALGVPVVATAVGRVPEMVDTTVGRVVAPRDAVALGVALAELASDDQLRARLSDAARDRPARTLDEVLEDHLALYHRVVGRDVS